MKTLELRRILWYTLCMLTKPMTESELNSIPREMVIKMYLRLADSFELLSKQLDTFQAQNESLSSSLKLMQEQVSVLTQQRFGRKTEKSDSLLSGQMSISEFLPESMQDVFNEIEATAEEGVKEPDLETITYKRKKRKGKRDEDLSELEVVVDPVIELSEEELKERFPYGYTRLADEVYRELEYVPAKFTVHEKHIAVYAGKNNTGIIKANRPARLLKNSLLTCSLAASIIDSKYVNHLPLNRISDDLKRKDVVISRQVMAGWMIKIAERYLAVMYRQMRKKLLESKLIHADETPFNVIRNGKTAGSKDYMWVYHTGPNYGSPHIYIYDYKDGKRSAEALKQFLDGYEGVLVTDGYEVYHTASRERPDKLIVAGCWAHLNRRFVDVIKAMGEASKGTIAEEGNRRIKAIYHVDNMYKDKTEEERLENRQTSVKPLVDGFFEWVKKTISRPELDAKSKTGKALSYAIKQEEYLRRFLEDGIIPLDNNDAERSIKSFCVGKHSWHVVGTQKGAGASAMLYSIAETAKANNLRTFEYFEYVLKQILIHQEDDPNDYVSDILPWSEKLPESCRKIK